MMHKKNRPTWFRLRRTRLRRLVAAEREYRQRRRTEWLSQEQPGVERALDIFERHDPNAGVRNRLAFLSDAVAEYAGFPMPLEGESLVIEPTYPWAEALTKKDSGEMVPLRNSFFSKKLRRSIGIVEHEGKIHGTVLGEHRLVMELRTMSVSAAWGVEQESRAIRTLAEMLTHARFKQYLLTGMFMESSKRSGVFYVFRRLRPTLAVRATKDGDTRVLAAMCMHPIGYYQDSWAGAMCPTDDVIAHLALMRGDEVMFWRRCNQHSPISNLAGL